MINCVKMINKVKAIKILNEIGAKCSKYNWDGLGAVAVRKEAVTSAKWIVNNSVDYEVHHIYPGLDGEVILEAKHTPTGNEHMLFCYTATTVDQYTNPHM